MQEELLPLFPLGVVLLPRNPLPLHIFEDRYKELIGDVLRRKAEFGVVLAAQQGIVNVGCTAVVEKVLKRYPDDRLDILVFGFRRFEVLLLNEDKAYLQAAVEYFDDEDEAPAPRELIERAMAGYRIAKTLSESEVKEPDSSDRQLSFALAAVLNDADLRQSLLTLRSEPQRIRRLAEYFPGYVARQRRVRHVREIAPRNGHGARLRDNS